jgi:hypothetical protein
MSSIRVIKVFRGETTTRELIADEENDANAANKINQKSQLQTENEKIPEDSNPNKL